MKSRALERSGSDTPDSRALWTKRVILGGLGTAGASIALAALAASAFANAANPLPVSTGSISPAGGNAVRVDVSGMWNWGELSGSSTQSDCAGRYGVGWSVDWWGMSNSPTATTFPDGNLTGSIVNWPGSGAPSLGSGTVAPGGALKVSGTNTYFHTSSLYNGFDADLCDAPDSLDANHFPQGPWGSPAATYAIYPSINDVPKQLCVNFYDPHGKLNQPSGSAKDYNAVANDDNSISKNAFNPASNVGYCFTPTFSHPLAISVDKTNDANQDTVYTDTETAKVAGQNVTFKLTITNTSTSGATEVIDSVVDDFPIPNPDPNNHANVCANLVNQTLAQGASVTCNFTLNNYAPSSGSLTDKVTVNAHEQGLAANTVSGADTSTVNAPVLQQAHLAANILLCSDPTFVLPTQGSSLTTSGGPTAVPAVNPGNSLSSTLVAPGTYTVDATAPTNYHIVVCGDNGASSHSVTLANGDDKTVKFFVAPNGSPNISFSKTGPSTGVAGQPNQFAYTITLTNTGSATAPGSLAFVDVLPAGETFANVQTNGTTSGMSCSPRAGSPQIIDCMYSHDLGQNTSATVKINVSYAVGTEGQTLTDCTGPFVNNANTCFDTHIVQPNVTVNKTGPAVGLLNDTGSYTIVATNNGAGPSTATSFTDTLPAGEVFVSQGSSAACSANGSTVTCQLGALDAKGGAHDSASFTVVVRYTQTGDLTDCATINGQPVPSCVTTHVVQPNLQVIKTGPAQGTLNGNGTYTMVVTNNGNGASQATTFTDTLPTGESFMANGSSSACSAAGQIVTCTVPGLAANGGSASYTVVVTYTQKGDLTDCATIAGQPVPSCVTTHIPGAPSISVVKTNDADGDGAFHDSEQANAPGDPVTFKVVVTNTSTDPLVIDSVNDAFAGTTALAECPQLLGVTLQPGDSVTCTFTVDNYAPAAGDSLTNTITVGGHQPNSGTPVTGTDTSTVTTKSPSPVDLAIVKNADKATVKAGNTLTYTLAVTNVGQGPTTGAVIVTDSVPSGLDLVSVDGGTAWDCKITNGTDIKCTYLNGVLNPGDAAPLITVVTTVNDTAVGTVINTGVVNTPGDVNPANDRSTVKTPVIAVLPEKIVKPTTPTTPTVLPFTGDRTAAMLPVGLAAILGGLLLMVAGRRRRRTN